MRHTNQRMQIVPQNQENQNQENQNHQREEHLRRFRDCIEHHDAGVIEWNSSIVVENHIRERSGMVNNTSGYHSGNNEHALLSVQMVDVDIWHSLFVGRDIHPEAVLYAHRLMNDFTDPNIEFHTEHLDVSLLLEENVRPGIHRAIFIINVHPYCMSVHGHIVSYEFEEGSEEQQTIRDVFREEVSIVKRCTEYDILSMLACEDEMRYMLAVFSQGMNSLQFPEREYIQHECSGIVGNILALGDERRREEAAAEEHQPPYQVPPPPQVNDFDEIYNYYYNENGFDENNDRNQEYQAAVAMRREENNEERRDINLRPVVVNMPPNDIFENQHNIIPYWLENEERINELIDIRQQRQLRRIIEGEGEIEPNARG